MLVQPATVDRWHREEFHRCWRRRSRRPGRPRIDSECRGLIRRLAAENCLWGAPRIHGELLKLGIVVSERTVSRYLPDRRRARHRRGVPSSRIISVSSRSFRPRRHCTCQAMMSRRRIRPDVSPHPVVVRCAVRLSSMRGRRRSLASTDVTWPASRSGSPSRRDQHPNQRRPGPADALTVRTTHMYAQRVDWCTCTGSLRRTTVSDD